MKAGVSSLIIAQPSDSEIVSDRRRTFLKALRLSVSPMALASSADAGTRVVTEGESGLLLDALQPALL